MVQGGRIPDNANVSSHLLMREAEKERKRAQTGKITTYHAGALKQDQAGAERRGACACCPAPLEAADANRQRMHCSLSIALEACDLC